LAKLIATVLGVGYIRPASAHLGLALWALPLAWLPACWNRRLPLADCGRESYDFAAGWWATAQMTAGSTDQ